MRGLRSRLAVSALALVLGAAGARSFGAASPAGTASCFPEATSAHASATPGPTAWGPGPRTTGGGWKQAESEPTGYGPGAGRPCRARSTASLLAPHATHPDRKPIELPVQRSRGLLGLGTSPANAPPRS